MDLAFRARNSGLALSRAVKTPIAQLCLSKAAQNHSCRAVCLRVPHGYVNGPTVTLQIVTHERSSSYYSRTHSSRFLDGPVTWTPPLQSGHCHSFSASSQTVVPSPRVSPHRFSYLCAPRGYRASLCVRRCKPQRITRIRSSHPRCHNPVTGCAVARQGDPRHDLVRV